MKSPRQLCLLGLFACAACAACAACVQPISTPEPHPPLLSGVDADDGWLQEPFHEEDSLRFGSHWTFGEVSGVTPEFYEVSLESRVPSAPGTSVRFEGMPGGAYLTMWTEWTLPKEEAAFLMELRWDQFLEEDSVMPFVWVRLDGEEGMIGMTDSRSQEKTAGGSWASCSMKVAVPVEARTAVVGVGMMGQGNVQYDRLRSRIGGYEGPVRSSKEARVFVEDFLEIVEADAMMRDNVNWKQMHKDMASLIRDAVTTADTYPALQFCLEALGDHHSRLLTPSFIAARGGDEGDQEESSVAQFEMPVHERMNQGIGYLWLPGHLSFGDAGPRAYASTLARALEELQDCKGFVIDLREDGGGNMWPMLAGLGPLLGAEVVGSFTYPDGTAHEWWYRDNVSGQADFPCTEVVPPHGASFPIDIPIAVLTSRWTGSSGEATLVAFLGRPNVRTFGQATTGLSTGNSSIPLSDGSILLLTTSVYADRNGVEYGGRIEPDVAVPVHSEGEQVQALQEAVDWLLR